MLIARYRHRLPADYPMARIRDRVAERAHAWDAMPGLVFKAVMIEDRSRGAAANAYSSLYLWQNAGAAADFIGGSGFQAVVESFGRPRIDTWLAFAVSVGGAATGRVLSEEMRFVAPDTDLAILREREEARGREVAGQRGVLASLTGLDAGAWRLTRFTLRAEPAAESSSAEIAHLAAPGLAAARHV
ncbi:MAG: DUF4865 family protein [Actinomycetospora chiangmaiensis]|nr:DUF4865 family protein [Actinomycetospora chiangmaiensis]